MTDKRWIWNLVGLAALFIVAKQVLGSPAGDEVDAEEGVGSDQETTSSIAAELARSNGDGPYWDMPGVDSARARFRFDQTEREVHGKWSRRRCAGESNAAFPVSFIPTGLSGLSDRTLCVFGVDEDTHDFIIEEWMFAGPARVTTDDEGNCEVAAVERESTRVLLRGSRDENDGVTSPRFVLSNRADPDALFVVFASGSVQSLDRTTGALTVVATPIGARGEFVPTLGFPGFNHAYSKTHKQLGHVYVLRSNDTPGPLLLLEDRDRDGSLDVFHEVFPEEWKETYGRASFYE